MRHLKPSPTFTLVIICHAVLFGIASLTSCAAVCAAQSTDAAHSTGRDTGSGASGGVGSGLASESSPNPPQVSQISSPAEDWAKVYVIHRLKHRAALHETPDALVRIPSDFDLTKPIRLIIYNHGFGTNVQSIYTDSQLGQQLHNADANTVLLLPEWQAQADSRNGNQGRFNQVGMFRAMLKEIFKLIPELHDRKLSDIGAIDIASHSAGYAATMTEIYKNNLDSRIRSIALLDALYTDDGFNNWVTANLDALRRGKKQFYNVFFDSTKGHSKDLAEMVKRLWKPDQDKNISMLVDYSDSDRVLSADNLEGKSVAFIYSTKCIDGLEQHFSIPRLYFGVLEQAAQKFQR